MSALRTLSIAAAGAIFGLALAKRRPKSITPTGPERLSLEDLEALRDALRSSILKAKAPRLRVASIQAELHKALAEAAALEAEAA